MPQFSRASLEKLATCDERLQKLFNEVIKYYDCTVIYGQRGKAEQDQAAANGFSKLKWPNSKHNKSPSLAIDVAPCPIDWKDENRFYHFAGFVLAIAAQLGLKIRWGGDFNQDGNFKNDGFTDLPHFEIQE